MGLQFLSCLELHIRREQIVDVGSGLICDVESDEGQPTEPDHHCSLEVELQEEKDLT